MSHKTTLLFSPSTRYVRGGLSEEFTNELQSCGLTESQFQIMISNINTETWQASTPRGSDIACGVLTCGISMIMLVSKMSEKKRIAFEQSIATQAKTYSTLQTELSFETYAAPDGNLMLTLSWNPVISQTAGDGAVNEGQMGGIQLLFCSQCGIKQTVLDAKFCQSCGTPYAGTKV